jgi:hypothetical protein
MEVAVLVARGTRHAQARWHSLRCQHAGLVGARGCGARPLAPDLDPALNERLVCPGGEAQFSDLPVPGGVALVLAVAEGQACALGQQVRPPGRGLPQLATAVASWPTVRRLL